MKYYGQHIYDYVATFKQGVTLNSTLTFDSVSLSAIQTSSESFVDNDTSIMTSAAIDDRINTAVTAEDLDVAADSGTAAVDLDSQSLTVTGGTSITTSATGQAVTINADATQAQITSLGSAGATTDIRAGDLTMYNAVNDGNPTISLGSSATNRLEIKSVYNSGAQTLCDIDFTTYTASGSANDGRYNWYVDEVLLSTMNDLGLFVYGAYIQCQADGATISALDTTASSATQGGKLRLMADDGAVMGDNHRLGVIEFYGAEDGSATKSVGARIQAIARDAWDGSNNDADLEFYTTDGTTESKVLTLDADKLATFTGAVTVTGALTGTLATASQTNITGVGTIDTGVWEGTDVATDQQKHVMHYQTTGYSIPDGTNYDIAKAMSTNAHPFQHDQSIGSDGLTAQTVQTWVRNGGHVMPRACTLKRWTGWTTAVGSGTHYIGLFKVTLVDGEDTDPSAVLLEEVSYTAAGNATAIFFNETSFTATAIAAGDIVFTALKGVSTKTMYFNATYEVEF